MRISAFIQSPLLLRVVAWCSGAAIVLFWVVFAQQQSVSAAYSRAKAQVVGGYLLNGARVPVDEFATGPSTWQPANAPPRNAASRRLVLVTADTCQWSRKSIDPWIDLLKTTPFHPGDEVVILSSGEEIPGRLATVLRNAGVAYRVLLRSEAEGLVMATGILSTPYTIALDSDNRMRLILRTVGGREADLVRTFFNR